MTDLCVLFFLLITSLPISIASPPHKLRLSASDVATLEAAAPPRPDQPTTVFEVDRPHRPPPGSFGPCSTLLLSHSFAFTYTKPPVTAAYSPPPCLAAAGGRASVISLAVLEWRATCRGVQYDRIFGVWLGGAELLRSCTAEPRLDGVIWSVSKDITKYSSLLTARNSTLAVYLGNIVNDQYTGVYHANLTLHLYFHHPPPPQPGLGPADVVVPISQSLPLNDGLWFQINNDLDVGSASLAVPTNTYRAVLEVYLSYHSDDEFWYTNTPDPFREVTVQIDGDLVGAVWPFPVVYTGGIHPLLWQPITGIGSFNLPSYDIEVTAFLDKLLDGKEHEFQFAVTNAQDVWFVDANLHLWLDPRSTATAASITSYDAPPLDKNIAFRPEGPGNALYYTTAFRHISASGWVQTSSYGKITATSKQRLSYENTNVIQGNGGPMVNQTTDAYSGVHVTDHAGVLYSQEAQQSFALYMFVGVVNQTSNSSYTLARNVQLGFGEERVAAGRAGFWSRSLSNAQDCAMDVDVEDGDGVGVSLGTHQTYRYEATDACYFRNLTSRGYAVTSDHSDEACVKGSPAGGVAQLAAAQLVRS
ncbi:peptide-N4-(N-acetyl-beta-glucosaminyl)asparagine amidase A-like [Phragmites australis]|uniref:peptide-N4-(N-acetyl-beta- glucosaminyl)asparagine amidase A-like n=1 Tax=Phragmites australis TaxID=29695 RepID=UPI002D781C49|nr:peptide-N4-(N-acetyl-beta-glucosaminyl)asparagine amidase A-like [Phragmites australis]